MILWGGSSPPAALPCEGKAGSCQDPAAEGGRVNPEEVMQVDPQSPLCRFCSVQNTGANILEPPELS